MDGICAQTGVTEDTSDLANQGSIGGEGNVLTSDVGQVESGRSCSWGIGTRILVGGGEVGEVALDIGHIGLSSLDKPLEAGEVALNVRDILGNSEGRGVVIVDIGLESLDGGVGIGDGGLDTCEGCIKFGGGILSAGGNCAGSFDEARESGIYGGEVLCGVAESVLESLVEVAECICVIGDLVIEGGVIGGEVVD